ncbi:carbon-nitrogen hydrolase family protein [Schlesneria sp. T3-172]|uniref:carbon-nitrogen hydrolase family protein n=1 Tax=Schlesneria sphaerica TaxID=3373610 RepID=UPI0037C8AF21
MFSRCVAVAQTTPVKGDVAANVEEHLLLAQLAVDEGADIVLFPELSLTGYELALGESLAFEENDARLAALVDLAERSGTRLVVGAPIRLEQKLYVGAFIILPDRSVEIYTKHRLGTFPSSSVCDSLTGEIPPPEPNHFQPGDRNPLIPFNETVAAVAICADIGRPEHPQRAAERQANLYLASMFVIPSDFAGDIAKLARYAKQYRMMVALANYGGPSGGLKSAGRSGIWSSTGELLVQLEEAGSGVAVVRESPDKLHVRAIMRK